MADTTTTTVACSDEKDIYADVPFCQGKKSLPGTRNHVYMIKKKSIKTWPTLPGSAAASLDKKAVYVGDFVLLADKKWRKIDLVPNENQPKSEQAGNWGAHVFTNTAPLLVPGTEEQVTGLITELNNDNNVFLVPQRNGKYRVFGNESFDCEVKLSQDWGKGTSDTNATTLEITVSDECPAPFYPGKIETSDGDISGADGKPITATA